MICGSYSQTLLIAIVVCLLHNTMVCLQKIITSKEINCTIYNIKLVRDEKAHPDSYKGALSIFEKIEGF